MTEVRLTKNRINWKIIITLALSTAALAASFHCSRDNPFDPNSSGYKPGANPEATFSKDTISCYIRDTVAITVSFSDSAAKGGGAPSVDKLYFSWSGDTVHWSDSVSVSGSDTTLTIYRKILLPQDTFAYVWARDNDGLLSLLDTGSRARLIVKGDKIVITKVIKSSDSVFMGDTVTIVASAKYLGSNGLITDFIWNINGVDSVNQDSTLNVAFFSSGLKTILVSVGDNDGVVSKKDTIKIVIKSIVDSVGPEIKFISPLNNDTVETSKIKVLVQAKDISSISFMLIKDDIAKLNDTLGLWQDSLQLNEGPNLIMVRAVDRSDSSNVSTKSITVFYLKPDLAPPLINFTLPQPGDMVYKSPYAIAVSVTDPSGVSWVQCNNDAMTNTSGSSYSLNVALKEGKNSLIIAAADKKGNTVIDTLIFNYIIADKIPPMVQIIKPAAGEQIATAFVQVRVSASDSGSGIDSVFINGVAGSLSATHYVRTVSLKHGFDTIQVVAVDASANLNTTRDSVIVVRNISPRFLPDSASMDTSLFKDSAATIRICAVDDDTDAVSCTFITPPGKTRTTPQIIVTAGGCATITGYTPDSIGLDTFSVRVADNYNGADTLRMRVFVTTPSSTKPYFTTDPATLPDRAVAGTFYVAQLAARDPNNKTLSYSLGAPPTPAGVSIDADARLAWTPGVADTGRKTVVAFTDNGTERDTIQWTVVVTMPDMPPNLQNPGNKTVNEMVLLTFALTAADPDGDSLLYSSGSSFPPGARLDSLLGVFTWTPTYKDEGVYTILFEVTEKHRSPALTDSQTITITVNNVNNAPIMTRPGNKTIYESELLSFNLQAADSNGDALVYSMKVAPAGAMIVNGNNFAWRPTTTQAGVYPLTFYVTDNGKPVMSDSAQVTITVKDSTMPVFAAHVLIDTTYTGNAYSSSVKAVDGDADSLVYSKRSGPDGLSVTGNYGVVSWKPTVAGLFDVTIIAVDHAGNTGTVSWKILVLPKWPRVFGNTNTQDTGYSVVQTTDGGYALCGAISGAGSKVPFLIRTDTLGNPIQFKMYKGPYASANSIQQTSDGGFILCGTDSSGTASKLLLIKTNGNGDTLWTARLGQTGSALGQTSEKGTSVCQTADGQYYLACGVTTRQGTGSSAATYKMYVVKVSAKNGAKTWDTTYSPLNGNAAGYCIQPLLDYNDGFIVCGESVSTSGGGTTGTDLYLVKCGASGRISWTRSIHETNNVRNVGLSILQTSDGGVIAGGYIASGAITTGFMMKVNSSGQDVFWTPSPDNNSAIISVKATSAGDYVACGFTNSGNFGGEDVLLHRFKANGQITLTKSQGSAFNDAGFSIFPTRDNGFVITGFTTDAESKDNTDIYLVKTDGQGVVAK